jgi:hypothetical protein
VSSFSKFPIFPLSSLFFPFSNSQTLYFFILSYHLPSVPLHCYFSSFLPSPNSIHLYFVLFQNLKATTVLSVLPARHRTVHTVWSDPTTQLTSTCRVLRQRSRRSKTLLYRLGSISWIRLLHFLNTSLSLPLFARSESIIGKPCLNIHLFVSYNIHRPPITWHQISIPEMSKILANASLIQCIGA